MRVNWAVQSEQQLRTTLDGLYAESRKGKSFTGILELVANEFTIELAVRNIKANDGSKTPGVDGKTIDHYLQMERPELIQTVQNALGRYEPNPVKRCYIPKANGKMRPLGIATILDRLVQECLRIVLEPILEARFYPHSYGFRPYRSTVHAVARAVDFIHKGNYMAVEGDIKGYFDNVNHRLLLKKLWRLGIIDRRILAIIRKMLKADILEKGKTTRPTKGTPQGGILSPLLANAYLNDLDWTIARMYADPKKHAYNRIDNAQAALRKRGIEPVFLTRYADDWIIQCRTADQAARVKRWVSKYLKHRAKLDLSEEKTLLTDSRERPLKFLGSIIKAESRRPTPSKPTPKVVGKAYPDPEKVKAKIKEICEDVRRLKQCPTETAMAVEIETVINSKIVGAANFYATGIAKKALQWMDWNIWRTARAAFRHIFKGDAARRSVPINTLSNRPGRHTEGRRTRTYAALVEGQTIGITLASITPIAYGQKFNQEMTPYTVEGRKRYREATRRADPLTRAPLYNEDALWGALKDGKTGSIYNFEYYQNREAAYNQTLRKGKGIYACMACGLPLGPGYRECHHIQPELPLDQVNKVRNLIWLCTGCHQLVERPDQDTEQLAGDQRKKIEALRTKKFGTLRRNSG